jgi:N-formylglutamate deformylase
MNDSYVLTRASGPVVLSIPHVGTEIPSAIAACMSTEALTRRDTDWHLDRLYSFATAMGVTVVIPRMSRYVVDLNRPPDDTSLYPGQTTTALCPMESFRGEPLYIVGASPDLEERRQRLLGYWLPYHTALRSELDRVRSIHGVALLWDAHSIASVLPRLFDGRLPDMNFGTNDGRSCDPAISGLVCDLANKSGYSCTLNKRFKGGFITRHYGLPSSGIHTIQLEMAQRLYMDEQPPFDYCESMASRLSVVLRQLLAAAQDVVLQLR